MSGARAACARRCTCSVSPRLENDFTRVVGYARRRPAPQHSQGDLTWRSRDSACISATCPGYRTRRPVRSARRISPARRAKAAWRPRAPAAGAARESGPGLEGVAVIRHRAGRDVHARRHRRPGRDPADLDDARAREMAPHDPAHVLGRPGAAVGRIARRRFLRVRLGRASRRCRRSPCASIPGARSTATGRCRSASARASRCRTSPTKRCYALLPDQLHADRRARRRRLFPRAVPPHQPAAVQGGRTRSSTA